MNNQVMTIEKLPSTKEERQNFIQTTVDYFLSGNVNALQLYVLLKTLQDSIDTIRKDKQVHGVIMDEVNKYVEKTFSEYGVEITKTIRRTYDFDVCGDPVYENLKVKEKEIKDQVKEREKVLTGIKEGNELVDVNTGVIINPPVLVKEIEWINIKLK